MNKIQELILKLKPEISKIDETILQFSEGKSPLIKEISNHLIFSGGKRIRPILLVLASKICDEKNKNYYNLAAAVELIHSATLLHDDVVDDSKIRRGKKTANSIWDNKAPILVGDYIFSIAFQLMVKNGNLEILDLLAKTSSQMADGEVLQLEAQNNFEVDLEKYLQIINGKTAVLFEASCKSAGLNCQASSQKVQNLAQFGKNLGLVFQIIDDILDYDQENSEIDKNLGDDFFEGKITLPLILLYENCNAQEKKKIEEIFERNLHENSQKEEDFSEILKLISEKDIIAKSYKFAEKFLENAKNSLSQFDESPYKTDLLTILNYAYSRKK